MIELIFARVYVVEIEKPFIRIGGVNDVNSSKSQSRSRTIL